MQTGSMQSESAREHYVSEIIVFDSITCLCANGGILVHMQDCQPILTRNPKNCEIVPHLIRQILSSKFQTKSKDPDSTAHGFLELVISCAMPGWACPCYWDFYHGHIN